MTGSDRISRALTALGPGGPDDAALNLAGALYDLHRTGRVGTAWERGDAGRYLHELTAGSVYLHHRIVAGAVGDDG